MAAVRGQTSVWPGAYLPVFHPAYSCHLFVVWKRQADGSTQ